MSWRAALPRLIVLDWAGAELRWVQKDEAVAARVERAAADKRQAAEDRLHCRLRVLIGQGWTPLPPSGLAEWLRPVVAEAAVPSPLAGMADTSIPIGCRGGGGAAGGYSGVGGSGGGSSNGGFGHGKGAGSPSTALGVGLRSLAAIKVGSCFPPERVRRARAPGCSSGARMVGCCANGLP